MHAGNHPILPGLRPEIERLANKLRKEDEVHSCFPSLTIGCVFNSMLSWLMQESVMNNVGRIRVINFIWVVKISGFLWLPLTIKLPKMMVDMFIGYPASLLYS